MKCQGKFKFKGFEKKEAGSFTAPDGKIINYPEKYVIKVDAVSENGVDEKFLKAPIDSPVIPQLSNKHIYDDVVFEFEVEISTLGSAKITPINVLK